MRVLIHTFFVLALPVAVAYFGVSVGGALALVLLALLWRLAISLSALMFPAKEPELELETIIASHFAEKVRWCMDRLGVPYTERPKVGIFGVLFRSRTVPELRFRTGVVRSVIGNSPEILRYLWGRYAVELGDAARFLEPTPERLEMEERIDRYGVNLQVWVYYHVLDHPDVTQRAWGRYSTAVPLWQRMLLPVLYPVFRRFLRRVFRINERHYANVVKHIEALLEEIEGRLADGRSSLLGGEQTDFVDIAFASMSGLWLQPAEYAAPVNTGARLSREHFPLQMGIDVDRWSEAYPLTVAFVERLYREERFSGA